MCYIGRIISHLGDDNRCMRNSDGIIIKKGKTPETRGRTFSGHTSTMM